MSAKRHLQALVALFLLALAVRGVVLWEISSTPLFDVPLGDGRQYVAWASEIAGGAWLGEETFYQAPLYPYFLAVVRTLFGADMAAVKILQAIFGALAAVLVALAGRRFFDAPTGLLAGLVLALYPPAIFFDGLVQKTSLALLLTAAFLALLGRLADGTEPGRRTELPATATATATITAAGAGAVLGLLALTRENALVLVPVVGVWLAVAVGAPARRRLLRTGVFALGLAAVLLPVGLRNLAVGGELLLTTAQLGPNFYIGNHAGADGRYRPLRAGREDARVERRDARELAEADLGHSLDAAEVSRYWLRRTLRDVAEAPVDWLKLLGRKARLLVAAREIVDTESLEAYRQVSRLLDLLAPLLHLGVLAPLAAAGLWTTRGRWRRLAVLYGVALAFAASLVAFYVMARYRFPLVPIVALFAAAGARDLVILIRERAWRGLLPAAGLAVLVAIVAHWPLPFSTSPVATTWYNLGVVLFENGDDAAALDALERAAAAKPDVAAVQHQLGRVHLARAEVDAAAEHTAEAVRLDPSHAAALAQLGHLRILEGRLDDAEKLLTRAVELDPADALAHNLLANLLAQDSRLDEAAAAYEAALAIDPDLADARFKLGLLLAAAGRPSAARPHLEAAVRLLPSFPDAHLRLAELHERLGDIPLARASYRRVLELRPGDPVAAAGLERLRSR